MTSGSFGRPVPDVYLHSQTASEPDAGCHGRSDLGYPRGLASTPAFCLQRREAPARGQSSAGAGRPSRSAQGRGEELIRNRRRREVAGGRQALERCEFVRRDHDDHPLGASLVGG